MSKKGWGPGRDIFWLIVGGLLTIVVAGPLESQVLLVLGGVATGLGLLLGAFRMMFK
jgi:hypothetical protein